MSLQSIRKSRWRSPTIAATVAATLVAGTMVATSAQAAAGCRVAYTVTSPVSYTHLTLPTTERV